MTKGALVFAFNNQQIDYVKLATWCAKNVKKHLQLPVALVTDSADSNLENTFDIVIKVFPESGGGRWFADYGTHVEWYNASRSDAYRLTPWDHSLVLDADYVVNSNQLNQLFDIDTDFLCFKDCFEVANPDRLLLPTFGRYNMPMWWATVMCFKKSNTAQFIFDAMHMVKLNWQHYRDLYGITETVFRNDYALSIALGIVSGHTGQVDNIPWSMWATLPEHTIEIETLKQDYNLYVVNYKNSQAQNCSITFSGQDFHAMGKLSLGAAIDKP